MWGGSQSESVAQGAQGGRLPYCAGPRQVNSKISDQRGKIRQLRVEKDKLQKQLRQCEQDLKAADAVSAEYESDGAYEPSYDSS